MADNEPVVFDTYRTVADQLYMLVHLPEGVDRNTARENIDQLSWVYRKVRFRAGQSVRTLMVQASSDSELTEQFDEKMADVMGVLKDLPGIDGTFESRVGKS